MWPTLFHLLPVCHLATCFYLCVCVYAYVWVFLCMCVGVFVSVWVCVCVNACASVKNAGTNLNEVQWKLDIKRSDRTILSGPMKSDQSCIVLTFDS